MNKIARLPVTDRRVLFETAAERRGLAPAIMEKDFWVCWMLKQLFSIPQFKGRLVFKGGTTLSKVFGVIERFSEDIDLIVDWDILGFKGARSPNNPDLSNTKREALLEEMLEECRRYIAGDFLTALRERLEGVLGSPRGWELGVEATDGHVVNFQYPAAFGSGYLRPEIRLELGTHAELIPQQEYPIHPYAADEFPRTFTEPGCTVVAITAERTFWEKVTILHREAFRAARNALPERTSRHYYDTAMLARSAHKAAALADLKLLHSVVEHKKRFYPQAWARYDLAKPGTMRLLPAVEWRQKLDADYRAMKEMIFGDYPAFDKVLETLAGLETEINGLASVP